MRQSSVLTNYNQELHLHHTLRQPDRVTKSGSGQPRIFSKKQAINIYYYPSLAEDDIFSAVDGYYYSSAEVPNWNS